MNRIAGSTVNMVGAEMLMGNLVHTIHAEDELSSIRASVTRNNPRALCKGARSCGRAHRPGVAGTPSTSHRPDRLISPWKPVASRGMWVSRR
jgi:hypothetical protein